MILARWYPFSGHLEPPAWGVRPTVNVAPDENGSSASAQWFEMSWHYIDTVEVQRQPKRSSISYEIPPGHSVRNIEVTLRLSRGFPVGLVPSAWASRSRLIRQPFPRQRPFLALFPEQCGRIAKAWRNWQ